MSGSGGRCGRCEEPASHTQGHQHLCPKHYRFGQMRANAKRHGKLVPSHDRLEEMVSDSMECQDCGRMMVWLGREDQVMVASLQHYRDGTLGLVCRTCNTRHAFMEGDAVRHVSLAEKLCPKCGVVKPRTEFYLDRGRSGPLKTKSYCQVCSDEAFNEWRIKNRGKYNAKQRRYRAERKAAGNPVRGGG